MVMTPKRIISTASALAAIWLVAVAATARAQDSPLPAGFKTQPLLKSGQTRDKQPIAYPKTDKPEIISVIGVIEPGGRTPLHEHPVPTGEAYIEALNHQHQLFNKGNVPAKVLVLFVGEEGKPTTITAK
jgi:hypothetical protein